MSRQFRVSGLNFFVFICVWLMIGFLSGCSTTSGPENSGVGTSYGTPYNVIMPITQPHDVYHEVAPLETLWRISKIYSVDQQTIISVNHLTDPTNLKVGQKLLIPQAREPQAIIPLYYTRPWYYIIIHHTATDFGNALSIDKSHHKRGFEEGLGYDFLIDNGTMGKQDGQIEISPRWLKQMDGAHTKASNMNKLGIGISLVGNFSEQYVSEAQMKSLVFLVNILRAHYNIQSDHIMGHRDVPGASTECPGNKFPWQEFRRRLEEHSYGNNYAQN